MPTLQLSLHLLSILLLGILAEPDPGRVPKVYNALITSNQNLEPSKAYPVYQPVLHDAAFAFPLRPSFYYGGEVPLTNGLIPVPPPPPGLPAPKSPASTPEPPAPAPESPEQKEEETPSSENTQSDDKSSTAPPPPPNTESPIPLNQYGLPPQVVPLGKVDPYRGFNQVGPFTYTYPGFRFYDPYDPYNYNPYLSFPTVYRPFTHGFGHALPLVPTDKVSPPPVASAPQPEAPATPPPSEPGDLNVLNYSSKDPAIPNVPPPPLPQGGLKSDKDE